MSSEHNDIRYARCTECLFSEPVFEIRHAVERYPTEKFNDERGDGVTLFCPECGSPLEIQTTEEQTREASGA